MAVREHRVSRRVLLGAACAFPLVQAAPRPVEAARRAAPAALNGLQTRPSPSSRQPQSFAVTKWDRALNSFRRAQQCVESAVHEPDQDRYDTLLDTFTATLRRLLRTPAPNLPALSLKIDLAVDQAAWELTRGEACLAALKRDARRLALRSS